MLHCIVVYKLHDIEVCIMAKVESFNDVQKEIERLRAEIDSLNNKNSDLELSTQKRLNAAFDRIDSIDSWASFINSISSLPGVKQPKWYKIEVPFEYNDVQERSGQVQISASGPFVCTQMQSYYKITETDASRYADYYDFTVGYPNQPTTDSTIAKTNTAAGRVIAPTSFFGIKNREWGVDVIGLDSLNANSLVIGELFSKYTDGADDYWYEGWSYPELDIRIQTANNNDYWSGLDSIPSAALYGLDSPLYLATPSIVQAADSVVAFARPTGNATVPLKGVFVLEMHGYHIGLHADIEDLLGV